MYDNERTAKCRPVLTTEICNGEASSMTGIASVCLVFLIFLLRKCAEYLAVWKIRVNTHTHTHTHTHTQGIARQDINYLLNINRLAKISFVIFATISFRKHLKHHIPPLPAAAGGFIVPDGDIRSTQLCPYVAVALYRQSLNQQK